MRISIIMTKENLKKKHHDFALEWSGDEKQYWINEDTDGWKTEECSFDFQDGGFTVSLVNDDGLFVSIVVPLLDLALAVNKVDLPAIIDRNIDKLEEAKAAFEKVHII